MTDRPIYLSPPHILSRDERNYLLDAFDSNWIATTGPYVDRLEKEVADMLGRKHAVALASGTASIHLGLILLGVGPGDEVIVPTLTFVASANPVVYLGAQPVFIDSNRETWNLDPELLVQELHGAALRGKLPKAVVVVDLFGQCADYEPIVEICEHYRVPILEDAAEALGASYKGRDAGAFGDITALSFNGNKIVTTGGGGMLLTDRDDWAERARRLAWQGRENVSFYEHREIGYTYRMGNLNAAVGLGQLKNLWEKISCKRVLFDYYVERLEGLSGIEFMPQPAGYESTRWLSCMTVDQDCFGATAEDIRLELERYGIESRRVWKPMHLQPVYGRNRRRGGEVAEKLFETGLCLPSGTAMNENDCDRIIDIIHELHERKS